MSIDDLTEGQRVLFKSIPDRGVKLIVVRVGYRNLHYATPRHRLVRSPAHVVLACLRPGGRCWVPATVHVNALLSAAELAREAP